MSSVRYHQVVIIGGGTAGTTVAASLLEKRSSLDVAVIEPSDIHYYQPAFTLVGGGTYSLARTARPQAKTLHKKAKWIRQGVTVLQPEEKQVMLTNGTRVAYDFLVVCPGVELNWGAIDGLSETLGRNGVCSNYDPAVAPYTWRCIDDFNGGEAVFTQPAGPIKCAGAPQKITYLASDVWRGKNLGSRTQTNFYSGMPTLFSAPDFIPHLERVAANYGVDLHLSHNLVSVDGDKRIARFDITRADGSVEKLEKPFDILHVTPPQRAPDFVRSSKLANADGWLSVDQNQLNNLDFPEIFALGDASSLPTSKTAAAVRKQAPVVVKNLLAQLDGRTMQGYYDGYTSCPLITARGKVILAEFIYGGKVTPTLSLDPFKESRFYWIVKKYLLPPFYWYYMLQGKEGDIAHKPLAN